MKRWDWSLDWVTLLFAFVMVPLVAFVDGGYIGFVVSNGNTYGAAAGVIVTASLLWGAMIKNIFFDDYRQPYSDPPRSKMFDQPQTPYDEPIDSSSWTGLR